MAISSKTDGQVHWAKEMFDIRMAVSLGKVDFGKAMTWHALDRSVERAISHADIRAGLRNPDSCIIEGEPAGARCCPYTGRPYPCPTRVIAVTTEDGIHINIVVALLKGNNLRIVTVY